jgi:hypothetical protein
MHACLLRPSRPLHSAGAASPAIASLPYRASAQSSSSCYQLSHSINAIDPAPHRSGRIPGLCTIRIPGLCTIRDWPQPRAYQQPDPCSQQGNELEGSGQPVSCRVHRASTVDGWHSWWCCCWSPTRTCLERRCYQDIVMFDLHNQRKMWTATVALPLQLLEVAASNVAQLRSFTPCGSHQYSRAQGVLWQLHASSF